MTDDKQDSSVVKAVRKEGSTYVVQLSGEIDLYHAPELREKLMELIDERPDVLVVNMAEVGYMDSSGVATLVEALRRMMKTNGRLKLAAMTGRVRGVFEIARLDRIFEIFPDEAEALSSG